MTASASSSMSSACTAGHSADMSRPLSPGRNDQISSVTNGMIGWSSSSTRSSTYRSVAESAERSATSSYRRGLTSSRYQSHTSPQNAPYSSSATRERGNDS